MGLGHVELVKEIHTGCFTKGMLSTNLQAYHPEWLRIGVGFLLPKCFTASRQARYRKLEWKSDFSIIEPFAGECSSHCEYLS